MTQAPVPGDPPVDLTAGTTATSGAGTQSTGQHRSSEVAKDQAAHVKDSAAGAVSDVGGVAKEQAGQVAGEAKRQARDLLHQSRSELQDQAAQQQQRAAQGLRSLSEELRSMGHGSQQQGVASDLAHQAAERTGSLASWLEDREPGALLDEVRGFARQRPMAFLALAAGAGVVVGRLGRGLQSDAQSDANPGPESTGAMGAMGPTPTSPTGVVPPPVPASVPTPVGDTARPYDTGSRA